MVDPPDDFENRVRNLTAAQFDRLQAALERAFPTLRQDLPSDRAELGTRVNGLFRLLRSSEGPSENAAYRIFGSTFPGGQPRTAGIAKYLQSLREEVGFIDIRGLQVASGKASRFPINELYIPLVATAAGEELDLERKDDEPGMNLVQVNCPTVIAIAGFPWTRPCGIDA